MKVEREVVADRGSQRKREEVGIRAVGGETGTTVQG
jgi:hypothetical protein